MLTSLMRDPSFTHFYLYFSLEAFDVLHLLLTPRTSKRLSCCFVLLQKLLSERTDVFVFEAYLHERAKGQSRRRR